MRARESTREALAHGRSRAGLVSGGGGGGGGFLSDSP